MQFVAQNGHVVRLLVYGEVGLIRHHSLDIGPRDTKFEKPGHDRQLWGVRVDLSLRFEVLDQLLIELKQAGTRILNGGKIARLLDDRITAKAEILEATASVQVSELVEVRHLVAFEV